ncbi:MAG TPA: protocatechuate 3,4-dioxygenase subunit alpha [Alphaproteobacteria bacterium]
MAGQTPSQTIGPYFAYVLTPEPYGRRGIADNRLTTPATLGPRIRIVGRLRDGMDQPVEDALIEIWQANAAGRYRHPADDRDDVPVDPAFTGFGRCRTGGDGGFEFQTVKPGRVPGRGNRLQAPHIGVIVQARGLQVPAFSRIYFSDEAPANGEDLVLSSVEEERRGTLIARREEAEGGPVYRFDIYLQGERETVFFDA